MKRLVTNTPTTTRRTISRIINELYTGQIDTKTANAIICACNALLGYFKVVDLEDKVAEIEKTLEDLENDKR